MQIARTGGGHSDAVTRDNLPCLSESLDPVRQRTLLDDLHQFDIEVPVGIGTEQFGTKSAPIQCRWNRRLAPFPDADPGHGFPRPGIT